MLRLRLQRIGKRNYATYRVVVADQHAPVKGRFIADVGWYNPHTNEFKVDAPTVSAWLSKGVQPSATVHNLLITHKLLEAEKVTIWRPKKTADTAAAPETTPAAPAETTLEDTTKPAEETKQA